VTRQQNAYSSQCDHDSWNTRVVAHLRQHAGRFYAVLFHYAVHDDAWRLELSEAVPVQEASANCSESKYTHGQAIVSALVPDEDPSAEPTIEVFSPRGHVLPYEIMCWFMEFVREEVGGCRAALSPHVSAGTDH
jgi:hypothetical protein